VLDLENGNIYLKNFLQVRIDSNFDKAKQYYEEVLGFRVDWWGHAERGGI
jgi:lactoylglutathione lyase